MIGHELAVEQGETAKTQPRDEPGQCDFRRVGASRHHALTEKGAPDRYAIEAADQFFIFPHLDRMGKTMGVQRAIGLFDRMIDPGRWAIRRGLGAQGQYLRKGAVGGHAETVAAQRPGERAGQVESIERQRRPALGLYPVDVVIIPVVGHGKDADRIGLKQCERVNDGGSGLGHGDGQKHG